MKQKILVIEDETPIRDNIQQILELELEEFEILTAPDGRAGIELIKQHTPDLVICDIMMPQMDGYDVLKELRQHPVTSAIPLIFLSAKAERTDFRRGMDLGADDYLTKPFTKTELVKAVETRLQRQVPFLQLQQRIEELQEANLFKDDFLNTASHELRSPMVNILMLLENLQVVCHEDKQQHYLKILQQQCKRELNLINDLLDLQQLQADSYKVLPEVINLQNWIPKIVAPFVVRAQTDQQVLQVDISPDLPSLISDSTDLQRIMSELLNNACKYTPLGGKIILKIGSTQELCNLTSNPFNPTPKQITFAVSNEAEIPAKELPHIFNKFYRVVSVDIRKQGGTGLGLSLVQKLVERLGGNLQVTSSAGWTTFTFHLCALLDEGIAMYSGAA